MNKNNKQNERLNFHAKKVSQVQVKVIDSES